MIPAPLSPTEIENGTTQVSFSFLSSDTTTPWDINPLFHPASVHIPPGTVPPASSATGIHLGSEDTPAPAPVPVPSPTAFSPDDVPPIYLLMPQNPRLFRVPQQLRHLDHHDLPFPFNYVAAGQQPPSFQTEPIENFPFFSVVFDGGRHTVATSLTSLLNTLQSVWLPCATREQAVWFGTTGYCLVESFNSQDLEWYLHFLHKKQNNSVPPYTSPIPLSVPLPTTPHGVPVHSVPVTHPLPPQANHVTPSAPPTQPPPLSSIGGGFLNGAYSFHHSAHPSPPLHEMGW